MNVPSPNHTAAPHGESPLPAPRGESPPPPALPADAAWRRLPGQLVAGMAAAMFIQLAHFLVTERDFPFGELYSLYAPESLLAGLWLGYTRSRGRLLACRCWLGVAVGNPLVLVGLQLARARWTGLFADPQYAWSFLVLQVALLAAVPVLLGELAGSMVRKLKQGRAGAGIPPTATQGRWFQFSLRTFFALTTLAALFLVYVNYFGPVRLDVSCRFARTTREAMEQVLSQQSPTPMDDSPFSWIVLDDGELAGLFQAAGDLSEPLDEREMILTGWPVKDRFPGHAQAISFSGFRQVRGIAPQGNEIEAHAGFAGGFAGFLGCRRAGRRNELSVDGQTSYSGTGAQAVVPLPTPLYGCDGKLRYEGTLPDANLVFFAPLGQQTYYLIIFHGREAPASN